MDFKNIIAGAILAAATQLCAVDATSVLLTFAPPEDPAAVDTYADGTTVLDGERYALVWYPKAEKSFGGITAAGTPVRPGDRIVKIAALAKDGRIPAPCVVFPVAQSYYSSAKLSQGVFALYLLDTRVATGEYDADGNPVYALSDSKFDVNASGEALAAAATPGNSATAPSVNIATASKAGLVASAPTGIGQPEIVDFKVADGLAYITLRKNANEVRVGGAENLAAMFVTVPQEFEEPNEDDTVTIAVPADGASGFFNVKGIR